MGKDWNDLVITDQFNITGRGLLLVVDLVLSGLCQDVWEKDLPKIDAGDTILYGDKVYTIKKVEVTRNAFNGGLMSRIGLLV
jgi:hypothetical protein